MKRSFSKTNTLLISILFMLQAISCLSKSKDSSPNNHKEILGPNSRAFQKIVEQNFVGKWQGQAIDKQARLISLELNVKSLGDNQFQCILSVPNEPIRIFSTSYQFGRNTIEGDGFLMSPITGGFADVALMNHPLFLNQEAIKFTLVPDA